MSQTVAVFLADETTSQFMIKGSFAACFSTM